MNKLLSKVVFDKDGKTVTALYKSYKDVPELSKIYAAMKKLPLEAILILQQMRKALVKI